MGARGRRRIPIKKLAPVNARARHLLAEDLGASLGAQLLKLGVGCS